MRLTAKVDDRTTEVTVRGGDGRYTVVIDGTTLEVNLADGYVPANGTTVRLIDYDSRSGTFSTVTPPQTRTVTEAYESDGLDVTIN